MQPKTNGMSQQLTIEATGQMPHIPGSNLLQMKSLAQLSNDRCD
jgi:hypothetical protein